MINLFDSYSNDATTINFERRLTKVYLLIMSALVISTLFYASLTHRTVDVEVNYIKANEFLNFYKTYPETISCACSQTTVDYSGFSYFDIDFHPVCSSAYIRQTWIDFMLHANVSIYPPNDIRTILSQFWQMIRSLCDLSKRTWDNAYLGFNTTILITMEVYSPEELAIRVQSSIDTSLKSAITSFEQNLFITRAFVLGNGLVSAFQTNWFFEVFMTPYMYLDHRPKAASFDDGCSCADLEGCPRSAIIYDVESNSTLASIPGLMYDCLITDGALSSSFECFYDLDCLTMLIHHQIIPPESRLLNRSEQFSPTVSVNEILGQLMIDRLSPKVNFNAYYDACYPSVCKYSYRYRPDIKFILTTLISIIGAGSTISKLLCQVFVKFIVKVRSHLHSRSRINTIEENTVQDIQSNQTTIVSLLTTIWNLIKFVNLFKSNTHDPHIIRRQRITTRIFLFILFFILSGFSIYWFTTTRSITVTVRNVNYQKYLSLVKNYSDTLKCPCEQIAQEQSKFITLKPEFHQLCSSKLVDPIWYRTLSTIHTPDNLMENDFRGPWSRVFFRTMHSFCMLIERFYLNSYHSFSTTSLILNYVPIEKEFYSIVHKLIGAYQEIITKQFRKQLEFIRTLIYSSQLSNVLSSNVYIGFTENGTTTQFDRSYPVLPIDESERAYTWFNPMNSILTKTVRVQSVEARGNGTNIGAIFSRNDSIEPSPQPRTTTIMPPRLFNCLCGNSGLQCGNYFSFFITSDGIITLINRYLVRRCIPTDSVLTSALECWYSPICTELVHTYFSEIGITEQFNTTPLDDSRSSRFSKTLTLATMMNELLIENWTMNISYERFFDACAVNYCIYSIQERFDWLFVIFNIVTFFDGLNNGLKICLPPITIVILVLLKRIQQRRSIHQQPSSMNSTQSYNTTNQLFIANTSTRMKQYLFNYNYYKTPRSTQDTRMREIFLTRTYIVLCTICIVLVIVYGGISGKSMTVTFNNISQTRYFALYDLYSDKLKCPCSQTIIAYETFITHMNATLHPICRSQFVTENFINEFNLVRGHRPPMINVIDFSRWAAIYFRYLGSICNISQVAVNSATSLLKQKWFLSAELLPKSAFQLHVELIINNYQKTIGLDFLHSLEVFRMISQVNGFVSVLPMNFNGKFNVERLPTPICYQPRIFRNSSCSCATSRSCSEPASMAFLNGTPLFEFEDIYSSCNLLESILSSTLRCFFLESCINEYFSAYCLQFSLSTVYACRMTTNPEFLKSLPPLSSESRFNVNNTIESLTYMSFRDSWSSGVSFDRYFSACSPTFCTYTYKSRWDPIFMLTLLISAYHGVCNAVYFLTPLLINFILRFINRHS